MIRFPFAKYLLCGFLGTMALLTSSCEEEEKELLPTYEAGVLIPVSSSQGAAGGSVSYYDRATGNVEADLFSKQNNRPLQGQLVSMTSAFERVFLVTSSQKVEVVNSRTFTSVGTIEGLAAPKNLVVLNSRKGYVSETVSPTDSGQVAVVNLGTYQITKRLKTVKQTGPMLLAGTRLFVASTQENKVYVFNTTTDKRDTTLTVGDNPNSMVLDASGALWVLCGGKSEASAPGNATKGQLIRFLPANLKTSSKVYEFPSAANQPRQLTLSSSKNRLYYFYDGVYVMDITAQSLPPAPLIRRRFETMAQDPADGLLYFSKAPVTGTNGWVIRYRNSGMAVDSFQVQGTATGFGFR